LKYNLKKLEDTNVQEVFQARLRGRVAPLMLLTDLDELEENITREMNAVTKATLKTNIKQTLENTLKLCDRRRELKKRRFEGLDQHGTNHTLEYKSANINIRRELRREKEK